jgi:hypothetical protein
LSLDLWDEVMQWLAGFCPPESLAICLQAHPKVGRFWMKDSVGETPTDATEKLEQQ